MAKRMILWSSVALVPLLGASLAWAYIPPSQYVVRAMTAKRAGHEPQERGLARAVRPEDAGERALGDAERHVVQDPANARIREREINGFQ